MNELAVRPISARIWAVKSSNGADEWFVRVGDMVSSCDCPDFVWRGRKCKHIIAVEKMRGMPFNGDGEVG